MCLALFVVLSQCVSVCLSEESCGKSTDIPCDDHRKRNTSCQSQTARTHLVRGWTMPAPTELIVTFWTVPLRLAFPVTIPAAATSCVWTAASTSCPRTPTSLRWKLYALGPEVRCWTSYKLSGQDALRSGSPQIPLAEQRLDRVVTFWAPRLAPTDYFEHSLRLTFTGDEVRLEPVDSIAG